MLSKANTEWELMILVLFLLHETTLGIESYWFPYLRAMPQVEFTFFWDQEILDHIEDEAFKQELKEQKQQTEAHWYCFKEIVSKYPQFEKFVDRDLFYSLYAQVCTRTFGYDTPSTCMVPMADNVNHNMVSASNEIINISLQQ